MNMTQVSKWNVGNFVQQLIEEGKTNILIEYDDESAIKWNSKSFYVITWDDQIKL